MGNIDRLSALEAQVESLQAELAAKDEVICGMREEAELYKSLYVDAQEVYALSVKKENELQAQLAQMREALEQVHRLMLSVGRSTVEEDIHDAIKICAEALAGKEPLTIASLVGTAPILCPGCGGEINQDYGKCRRCG